MQEAPRHRPDETPADQLDRLSREEWCRIIESVWVKFGSPEILELVVGGGEEAWIARAKEAYGVHQLHLSDYERMFRTFVEVVRRRRKAIPVHG